MSRILLTYWIVTMSIDFIIKDMLKDVTHPLDPSDRVLANQLCYQGSIPHPLDPSIVTMLIDFVIRDLSCILLTHRIVTMPIDSITHPPNPSDHSLANLLHHQGFVERCHASSWPISLGEDNFWLIDIECQTFLTCRTFLTWWTFLVWLLALHLNWSQRDDWPYGLSNPGWWSNPQSWWPITLGFPMELVWGPLICPYMEITCSSWPKILPHNQISYISEGDPKYLGILLSTMGSFSLQGNFPVLRDLGQLFTSI